VVTICDHLLLFVVRQLKNKICRKAVFVAFDCLVQGLCRDTIDCCQVGIEKDLLSANGENQRFEESRVLYIRLR
jgi:hypothetical protein